MTIIGPSGAGKTTLLRIIAGLERQDSGEVSVIGKVGMVFQQPNLWPHKTVLQNITEPLVKVKKLTVEAANQKAFSLLSRFGLETVTNSFPESLSGGEAQRVAIIRTLAMDPEILLLDEVTSSLDPELVSEVLVMLKKITTDKRTLIAVTHEMGFAKEISDRVIFFENGAVIESGHPHKIFTNPESERVRNFVMTSVR